jgi:hypothetical protein
MISMKNKAIAKLMTATAVLSIFSAIAPANAASLQNSSEWNNLTGNPVQDKSTDKSGFQALLDDFRRYVQPEAEPIPENQLEKLDPKSLLLQNAQDIRVWFLNSSASYGDQIAYEATKGSSDQKGLVFQNTQNPNVGDYVDLGNFTGGTQLSFWLRANGAQPDDPHGTNPVTQQKNIYGADPTKNPDLLDHLVAYEYKDYLILGFEDLYGPVGSTAGGNIDSVADRDFNDAVFVLNIPKSNLRTNVPEPKTASALLGVGAVSLLTIRRRHNRVKNNIQ